MRHSKKMIALLLIAVILIGTMLTGCKSKSKGTSDTKEPTGAAGSSTEAPAKLNYDGVTLSLVMAKGWDTPGREALLKKYTEKTGVKFDVQMLPDDMATDLIKTKFATKELPDIILNSGSVLENPYMLPEENLVDLSDQAWVNQLRNKDSFMADGKIWGMPLGGQGFFGFAINTKVFADNGLSIPTSKAELEKCFETLKKNGVQPMYLGSKDPWLVGNMTSGAIQKELDKDPDLINKLDTNQLKYADIPGFVETLNDLRRWNKLGYLGDNTMADSWDGEYEAIAEGKAGVTIGLTTWDVTLEDKYPGSTKNIELIPFYIGDCDTYFAGTTAEWYVPKTGKHIDIVKDFFNFIAQQDNLNEFYQAMGEPSTPWQGVQVDCLEPTKKLLDNLNNGVYGSHFGHNNLVAAQDFDGLCKIAQEVLIGDMTAEKGAQSYDKMRAQIAKALGMKGF